MRVFKDDMLVLNIELKKNCIVFIKYSLVNICLWCYQLLVGVYCDQ